MFAMKLQTQLPQIQYYSRNTAHYLYKASRTPIKFTNVYWMQKRFYPSTEVASVTLEQQRKYQPIIRTWVGPIAFVTITRPEIFEVRQKREAASETLN
jgi:hypothetical protein